MNYKHLFIAGSFINLEKSFGTFSIVARLLFFIVIATGLVMVCAWTKWLQEPQLTKWGPFGYPGKIE